MAGLTAWRPSHHAALAALHLGIRAVIAKSYARIHRGNLIAQGVVPFVFADEAGHAAARVGETWTVEGIGAAVDGGTDELTAATPAGDVPLQLPLTPRERDVLRSGGLLHRARQHAASPRPVVARRGVVKLPPAVTLVEVGPRDGLQSHPRYVETPRKVDMITRLVAAGLRESEATSFAHPRVVPHLADAEAVMAAVPRSPGVRYRALVPNHKGAQRVLAAGADVRVVLLSASETYSRLNQEMTTAQALAQAELVAQAARDAGKPWTLIIAMAFFSPYDGPTPPHRVLEMLRRLVSGGPEQAVVATTSGLTGPGTVAQLCRRITAEWPDLPLGLHPHNTNGMGLACTLAALDAGATGVEGSICGIGGGVVAPPTAPDMGNVPTEDLIPMLADLGVDTGVDPDDIVRAAREVSATLELGRTGFVPRAGTRAEVVQRHHAAASSRVNRR
jgi:hydroxymethylglutaryl-CoA lyase